MVPHKYSLSGNPGFTHPGLPELSRIGTQAASTLQQADQAELTGLCKLVKGQFNENEEKLRRTWGGGIMGVKNQARMSGIRKMLAKEAAKKAGM